MVANMGLLMGQQWSLPASIRYQLWFHRVWPLCCTNCVCSDAKRTAARMQEKAISKRLPKGDLSTKTNLTWSYDDYISSYFLSYLDWHESLLWLQNNECYSPSRPIWHLINIQLLFYACNAYWRTSPWKICFLIRMFFPSDF